MTASTIDRPAPLTADEFDRGRPLWVRAVRGRQSDPAWVRPSLVALLLGTALLYIWGLGASGYANTFYSAAVQAGTKSWKAMFFGSFDSSSFITVDKPPAALWVMEVSARIFGLSAWSVLVPQALEGVAAVGLLYATVRRRFSAGAGLIAGATLATTPVATLMFRFNNPDSLLVLLLVGAAYAVTRALESTKTRWLVLAGALVGLGFITKMLQAFLVVPGFGLVYLVYAQTSVRRRVMQLLAALGAIIVAAGWWVAAVMLTPASARPYVGGSTNDSILQLAFGYNGFGRLTGHESGSVGGGGTGATGMWGKTGITRLFNADMGGQISWLIPAALLLAAASIWALRRAGRADGQRAQVLLWLSWLVVTGLTFSLGKGIIHPYYTVALAPAVGALVGIGAVVLWRDREQLWSRLAMAAILVLTALWSYRLLDRSPSWHPALRVVVLAAGLAVAAALLTPPALLSGSRRQVGRVVAAGALIVGLAGPAAYALDTASTAYAGAIPSAGPSVSAAMGGPGGFAGRGGPGGGRPGVGGPGGLGGFTGSTRAGGTAGSSAGTGGFSGGTSAGTRGGFSAPTGTTGGLGTAGVGGGFAAGRGGGAGGLLNAGTVSSALKAALQADASSYTWVAATVGAETASGYQLAADEPVMAIGGFNGTDQAPSLAAFERYVSEGKIHYFISGGGGAGPGGQQSGSDDASQITAWVEAHFTATTIGGTTVYDLATSGQSG